MSHISPQALELAQLIWQGVQRVVVDVDKPKKVYSETVKRDAGHVKG